MHGMRFTATGIYRDGKRFPQQRHYRREMDAEDAEQPADQQPITA